MNLVAHQKRRICLSALVYIFNIHLQWTCHCPPKCFRSTHPSKSIFDFLWVKQCHKPSPSQTSHHHFLVGGLFTIPSHGWFIVVYGIDFPHYPSQVPSKWPGWTSLRHPGLHQNLHGILLCHGHRKGTALQHDAEGLADENPAVKNEISGKRSGQHMHIWIYIYIHGYTIHIYIYVIYVLLFDGCFLVSIPLQPLSNGRSSQNSFSDLPITSPVEQ